MRALILLRRSLPGPLHARLFLRLFRARQPEPATASVAGA